jgi:glc operon protein GlcG
MWRVLQLSLCLLLIVTPLFAAEEAALVTRGHVKLTLAGAQRVAAAAQAKAESLGLRVNIAVVDDGGHLIAFARMDHARPASVATALTKATAAATMRVPTGPLPPGGAEVDTHLSLAVEQAALASGGKMTTLWGGVPITVEGHVIGAVGVGGAKGEEDAEIARAGVAALLGALNESP